MQTQQGKPTAADGLRAVARHDLEEWAAAYRQRDPRVIQANRAGLGVNEIVRITGLAKTTVLRILRTAAVKAAP